MSTTLRVWQHVRLRSTEINVGGAILRLDPEGVVEDESGLTPEIVRVMSVHPNWRQIFRDNEAILRERIRLAEGALPALKSALEQSETAYRQATTAYDDALAAVDELRSKLPKPPEPKPEVAREAPSGTPKPVVRQGRVLSETERELLEHPERVKDFAELKAIATTFGIKTARKGREQIEAEMRAVLSGPAKETKS